MDIKDILKMCDHTNLSVTATWEDIKKLIDEGIKFQTASVCIPPRFVKEASCYAEGRVKVCTVIGFPNGYNDWKVKVFETKQAISDGADEIDMVINIGMLKEKDYVGLLYEINEIKKACGTKILKVIIETCLLSKEEIIKMCEIVSLSDADFIKTSTGFSTAGATFEDIKIMKEHIDNGKLIKAAGGIKTLDDAKEFIKLGASRLGTSRIVKLVTEQNNG